MELVINLVILNLGLLVGFFLGFSKGKKDGYKKGIKDSFKEFENYMKFNLKSPLDAFTAQKLMNELMSKN